MNDNILKAKDFLHNNNCTCVLVKDELLYSSEERGVKPLLEWLESGVDFKGYSAADKVVGKAAAELYVLLGITEIYANVVSKHAIEVLKKFEITVDYEICVDAIRNRTNTGFCPMEQATMNSTTPQEALLAIKSALKELRGE